MDNYFYNGSYKSGWTNYGRVIGLPLILPYAPNKTGKNLVRFNIPTNCEIHYGKLLALAEAHNQIENKGKPLMRKVSDYLSIKRYMGDDIGNLFLKRNFLSVAATKSYLQALVLYGNELDDKSAVLHYNLAAHARSHAGGRGEFISATTATYLRDGKFSGMTIEETAFEYLQRGVMSFNASFLFKLMPSLHYEKLSPAEQTQIHKEYSITPFESEHLLATVAESREKAHELVLEVCQSESPESIVQAIIRICNGHAISKEDCSYCLMKALDKPCIDDRRRNCFACDYELLSKGTMFYLLSEYRRMQGLFRDSDDENEKAMFKNVVTTKLLPKIQEMLMCLKEDYPPETYEAYKQIVMEDLNVEQ
jgi:hypothetical protein